MATHDDAPVPDPDQAPHPDLAIPQAGHMVAAVSVRARQEADLAVLVEWAEAGETVDADLTAGLDALEQGVQAGETKKMLGGEHDRRNAIVSIHPGAGGTESQDWAEMLLRMYVKWSDRRGFRREVLDYQPGEEAGIKSVTYLLTGEIGRAHV